MYMNIVRGIEIENIHIIVLVIVLGLILFFIMIISFLGSTSRENQNNAYFSDRILASSIILNTLL